MHNNFSGFMLILLTLLTTLLQISLCQNPSQYYFKVFFSHFENPTGTTKDGSSCSEFSFMGAQCSMYFQACVTPAGSETACQYSDSGAFASLITRGTNRYDFYDGPYTDKAGAPRMNPIRIPLDVEGNFQGFNVSVKITANDDTGAVIDEFTIEVPADSDNQGIKAYTSARSRSPTILTFAWNAVTHLTTAAPTTTGTTGTSGTTVTTTPGPTTTTPKPKYDCEDFEDSERTNGVKLITIGENSVPVYCEYGTNGIGSLTTIQSRGNSSSDYAATAKWIDYTGQLGYPGKNNNSWLGLDNMNILTTNRKDYVLQIDLCCGGKNKASQLYHNFTIGDSSKYYALNAIPDIKNIGLDYGGTISGKKDIGAPFKTYENYTAAQKELCAMIKLYDDAGDESVVYDNGKGGWWFGSCGNNLNGVYISKPPPPSCNITTFPNISGTIKTAESLGLEMRTTSGVISNEDDSIQWDFDGISYDRVRMAIYRNGNPPSGYDKDAFCK